LPAIARLGTWSALILLSTAINDGSKQSRGRDSRLSTDKAFALGVLALVAPGGTRLCVYLLTRAIADDLVSLLVIATAYTAHVSVIALVLAIGFFSALLALRYLPRLWR